jgi:membrane protein implicated in regulation of membrane protease activity
MLRFVPGFAAAIGAFLALNLVTWLPFLLQFLVFLGTYGFLAVAVDKSLKRYGDGKV